MSAPAEQTDTRWPDAVLALKMFAVDPAGTGVALRSPAGPVRDRWLALLREAFSHATPPHTTPWRKMPASIGTEALLGGLDFAATLQSGQKCFQPGILQAVDGGILVAAMAERLPPATVGILCAALDAKCRFGVVALDEGLEDEAASPALLDRMAYLIDFSAMSHHDMQGAEEPDWKAIAAARALLPEVSAEDGVVEALCAAAAALGAGSVRAPLLALLAARASAALAGRTTATMEDAAIAARLVLAPRATRLPAASEDQSEAEPPPPEPPTETESQDMPETQNQPPPGAEMVLEAARAAIPAKLLERLNSAQDMRRKSTGSGKAGARQKTFMRGRPVGVRASPPSAGARLNLIETLRAAAPWQRLRSPAQPGLGTKIRLRKEDFRVTRTEQRTRSTTIFVVDASGSSALNRLAEAKGAVELLLADCYRRRDEVALLAFRGRDAKLLLPPTRSLVRAKRSLSSLPGGGGTPLAAGIDAGFLLASGVRRAGDAPMIVLLTDGRANVSLSGAGGRAQAEQDALQAGRRLRAATFRSLLVDISPRPNEQARLLALEMGALYLPLPFAGAAAVSGAVRAASGKF